MNDSVNDTLDRMMARGGTPFHEAPSATGLIAFLRRLLGMPRYTHYYEKLDGSHVPLTKEEASEIAPIELEMFSKKAAVQMMRDRRQHRSA